MQQFELKIKYTSKTLVITKPLLIDWINNLSKDLAIIGDKLEIVEIKEL